MNDTLNRKLEEIEGLLDESERERIEVLLALKHWAEKFKYPINSFNEFRNQIKNNPLKIKDEVINLSDSREIPSFYFPVSSVENLIEKANELNLSRSRTAPAFFRDVTSYWGPRERSSAKFTIRPQTGWSAVITVYGQQNIHSPDPPVPVLDATFVNANNQTLSSSRPSLSVNQYTVSLINRAEYITVNSTSGIYQPGPTPALFIVDGEAKNVILLPLHG